jgi:hypothetical protein
MKKLLLLLTLVALAAPAVADEFFTFGWEDGTSTMLSVFPLPDGMIATNVTSPEPVYDGSYSLKTVDNAVSGTPQGYVAWIRGLQDGDIITASIARYDDTPGASPSGRIWGHYNDNPLDVNGYNGSAGGTDDYGLGLGWDITSKVWTMSGGHTGLVIEVRTYSVLGDTVWWDNLTVQTPTRQGIFCEFPGGYIPVENNTISSIKALY